MCVVAHGGAVDPKRNRVCDGSRGARHGRQTHTRRYVGRPQRGAVCVSPWTHAHSAIAAPALLSIMVTAVRVRSPRRVGNGCNL